MVTDVTERRRAQRALEYQALHDALTGLPNRVQLADRLGHALEAARAAHEQVAVLILDLDHFKEVNETFGHQAGDRLLEQVGPRLRSEIRPEDMVARLGGDEFAVLLPKTDATAATLTAARLLGVLERPFEVEGQHLDVAVSIGLAMSPDDGDDPDTLLRRADIALFVAKQPRGSFVRYAPEHERQGASRLALMAELREALQHDDELFLQFQPLVSLSDRSLAGVEALVRWRQPQRGLVPPVEFVPFAEKTRLIKPLTRWVLVSALQQSVAWQRAGHSIPVSVNISMRDLVDPEFPEMIATLVRAAQAPPSLLVLEITESLIMTEPERAIKNLSQLRELGVRLAVDDFGTGYSSLAYLHRLPIHEIKIDKSFVAAMTGEASRANIVRSSVELGHSLQLDSVAEGVEDARTWDLLGELGCDLAQGYFISRPMVAGQVLPWLATWESPQALPGKPPDGPFSSKRSRKTPQMAKRPMRTIGKGYSALVRTNETLDEPCLNTARYGYKTRVTKVKARVQVDPLVLSAEALILKGKDQGFLAPDDVMKAFPSIEGNADGFVRVVTVFQEMGISVTADAEAEQDADEEEN